MIKKILMTIVLGCGVLTGVSNAQTGTVQQLFPTPQPIDLSHENWADAFKEMNAKISREYAFTEYKGIDFKAFLNEYLPQIEAAQKDQNTVEYYRILQDYIQSLHDAHAVILPITDAAKNGSPPKPKHLPHIAFINF